MTTPAGERLIESRLPALGKMQLADLGGLSPGQLPDLDTEILTEAIRRALPEVPSVPESAFNSAI